MQIAMHITKIVKFTNLVFLFLSTKSVLLSLYKCTEVISIYSSPLTLNDG